MSDGSQGGWFAFAAALSERGYRVLTYNRRSSCPGGDEGCSEGSNQFDGWRDLVAAVQHLRSTGVRRVAVGGASLGAMESLYVAGTRKADVDALIWVAGLDMYQGTDLVKIAPKVRMPKLFLSGAEDVFAAKTTEELHQMSPPPKQLVLLDSGEHGTDILAFEDDEVVVRFFEAVVQFLDSALTRG
jgi:pimeloyl-ACP methyl ester carboxylesterase